MASVDKKRLSEKGPRPSDTQLGDVYDLHDLNVLGYKPELQRNRSMFTLLFQSLAIAAVSVLLSYTYLTSRSEVVCRYHMDLAVRSYLPCTAEVRDDRILLDPANGLNGA